MTKKWTYIIVLSLWPLAIFGQSDISKVIDILNQSQEVYEAQNAYAMDATYTLYQGAESDVIDEAYDALLIKQEDTYYSRIHHTEHVYFAKAYLKANHDQKRFQYGAIKEQQSAEKGITINNYLNFFKEHKLTETANTYICTLTSTAITPLPFGKVVMHIDKKTLQIKKQVLYYLGNGVFKDDSGNQFLGTPRLEITFSPIQTDISTYEEKLLLSSYVQIKKNKAIGIGSLASYESITF
ncbi:hypothetical protein [Dokdonia sp.]|uniref:hypothetical protein n=1 Tax=Dokdonia sp. TaxID=2024995 RepID=UPI0032655C9A